MHGNFLLSYMLIVDISIHFFLMINNFILFLNVHQNVIFVYDSIRFYTKYYCYNQTIVVFAKKQVQ